MKLEFQSPQIKFYWNTASDTHPFTYCLQLLLQGYGRDELQRQFDPYCLKYLLPSCTKKVSQSLDRGMWEQTEQLLVS